MKDVVNNPSHYKIENVKALNGDIVSIDVLSILQALDEKIENESTYPFTGMEIHQLYSAIAYILRSPFKNSFEEDLQKAIFYLKKLSD